MKYDLRLTAVNCAPLTVAGSNTTNATGEYQDILTIHCDLGYISSDMCTVTTLPTAPSGGQISQYTGCTTTVYDTLCTAGAVWSYPGPCIRKHNYLLIFYDKYLLFEAPFLNQCRRVVFMCSTDNISIDSA